MIDKLATAAVIGCLCIVVQAKHDLVSRAQAKPLLAGKDLSCVATAVYHEARGESEEGQIAVAYTILNRIGSPDFPDTPCAVVYQRKPVEQFSGIHQARPDRLSDAWKRAQDIAQRVFARAANDPTKGARFYYNPRLAPAPAWARTYVRAVVDNHVFYDLQGAS